jgi:hypothetical protein
MLNITIGRFKEDPEAHGVIRPEDDSWQLVIDKEDVPHLYVKVALEGAAGAAPTMGMLCIEDMLPKGLTIKSLMREGAFGGLLAPEEEAEAAAEYAASRAETGIPCPRP